jgi:septal ring factor EnvC (AmiA/AmiB activator)
MRLRLLHRGWIQLASLVLLICGAAVIAHRLGRSAAVENAERSARALSQLDVWRAELDRQTSQLNASRHATERALREVTRRVSVLQMRTIQLDMLARRLVERVEFVGEEFDFDTDPPLGGPEEAPDLRADQQDRTAELAADVQVLSAQLDDRWLQLEVLDDLLRWRSLSAEIRPEGRPVSSGYVSSRFGVRTDPFTGRKAQHRGIDFAGRQGTQVVAVASGIVIWSGRREGYGQMVEIDHGQNHITRYAHNAANLVAVGDVVSRGQTIARLGATGRATGPNLHFEVLLDGHAVNPSPYLELND